MKKALALVLISIIVSAFIFSVSAKEFDLANVTEVYRNTFDNGSALNDFSQFGGKWKVNSGRLYLTSGTNNHSFIIYKGDDKLTSLSNYIIDVDMYNVRSQAGVIVRSDLNHITSGSNGFAGYFAFISFSGTKGAIGIADRNGGWAGNLKVSNDVTAPGMNLHLRVILFENNINYIVSDLTTKKVLWEHTEVNSEYTSGSFGFRMSSMIYGGMINLWSTSFDNLVVSEFVKDEPEEKEDICESDIFFSDNASRIISLAAIAQMLGAEVEYDVVSGVVTAKFPAEDFNTPIRYKDLMKSILSSRFEN
ncbi:MAG: hypothetical protein E7598_05665 [Ruminococcaceae bacterium]|nr:hypothetical protein [Oscillospiraceae bacterium]